MKITENTFFTNDNLDVLRQIDENSVDMIYLDPPFNSEAHYGKPLNKKREEILKSFFIEKKYEWKMEYAKPSFSDVWTKDNIDPEEEFHLLSQGNEKVYEFLTRLKVTCPISYFSYLLFMSVRLIEMHRILKPTGTIFYHCDDSMAHYVKQLLDLIFGHKNYRNNIIWKYSRWTAASNKFQRMHDDIFFYSKSNDYKFNTLYKEYSNASKKAHQERGYIQRGDYKSLPNEDGVSEDDVWDINFPSRSKERTGYPTQKPLELLERIIECSTNPGDIILDPFAGCATACVAAEKLNRKWIGIDINKLGKYLIDFRLQRDLNNWEPGKYKLGTLEFFEPVKINQKSVEPKPLNTDKTFVYVAQEERNGERYSEKKIGFTKNLKSREKSMNGALSPTKYVFTAAWEVENGLAIEKHLHEHFKDNRQIGEWFKDDKEQLINIINNIMILFNGFKIK